MHGGIRRRGEPAREAVVSRFRMAIDVMGGDHAPRIPIAGALQAARQDRFRVLLVGDEGQIRRELASFQIRGLDVQIVPASETIGMDESPLLAVRRKKDSSIAVAARLIPALPNFLRISSVAASSWVC